jgi:hypothetical protein
VAARTPLTCLFGTAQRMEGMGSEEKETEREIVRVSNAYREERGREGVDVDRARTGPDIGQIQAGDQHAVMHTSSRLPGQS